MIKLEDINAIINSDLSPKEKGVKILELGNDFKDPVQRPEISEEQLKVFKDEWIERHGEPNTLTKLHFLEEHIARRVMVAAAVGPCDNYDTATYIVNKRK